MEVLVPFLSFFLDFAVSRGLSWSILSGTLTSRLHSVAVTVLSGNPKPSMSFHGSNRTELSSWVVFFFYLKQWREMALAFALHHSHESEHVSLCVLLLDASLIPPPPPPRSVVLFRLDRVISTHHRHHHHPSPLWPPVKVFKSLFFSPPFGSASCHIVRMTS